MKAREKLRGVGVGAGYFSRFQYEAWNRMPEAEITAMCSLAEAEARPLMAEFDVPRFYGDWKEMIDREKPDFVDIITPPPTHEEICAYAAARGVHVICQKPLAPTLGVSRRIVDTAQDAGIRFMVHENWRWQPWYRAVKQVQLDGEIGEFTHMHFLMRMGDGWGQDAYLARQPFFRDYPRLLIYETGVHFIDTFRYLFGEVVSVYAHIRKLNPVIRGEDAGQLFLRFESGATAVWDASRYTEAETPSPRYTFGTMRIDGSGGHLTMDAESRIRVKVLGQPARELDYVRENKNFAGDCVFHLQRHFVDCMRSGAAFESNGSDYLKTIRVVEAAYESADTGQAVQPE